MSEPDLSGPAVTQMLSAGFFYYYHLQPTNYYLGKGIDKNAC
jgi:hypothetical protein